MCVLCVCKDTTRNQKNHKNRARTVLILYHHQQWKKEETCQFCQKEESFLLLLLLLLVFLAGALILVVWALVLVMAFSSSIFAHDLFDEMFDQSSAGPSDDCAHFCHVSDNISNWWGLLHPHKQCLMFVLCK